MIADADHSMDVVMLEQFGPVLPVIKISSHEEAIALANDKEFGLNASVCSTDQQCAINVAVRACLSQCTSGSWGWFEVMPFGGVKQSRLGWEQGA